MVYVGNVTNGFKQAFSTFLDVIIWTSVPWHMVQIDISTTWSTNMASTCCLPATKAHIIMIMIICQLYSFVIGEQHVLNNQWRHQNFLWGGHRGGKMRFWGGKNPKICWKWLILAIFSFWWGKVGGRSSDWVGQMPPCPLDAAAVNNKLVLQAVDWL